MGESPKNVDTSNSGISRPQPEGLSRRKLLKLLGIAGTGVAVFGLDAAFPKKAHSGEIRPVSSSAGLQLGLPSENSKVELSRQIDFIPNEFFGKRLPVMVDNPDVPCDPTVWHWELEMTKKDGRIYIRFYVKEDPRKEKYTEVYTDIDSVDQSLQTVAFDFDRGKVMGFCAGALTMKDGYLYLVLNRNGEVSDWKRYAAYENPKNREARIIQLSKEIKSFIPEDFFGSRLKIETNKESAEVYFTDIVQYWKLEMTKRPDGLIDVCFFIKDSEAGSFEKVPAHITSVYQEKGKLPAFGFQFNKKIGFFNELGGIVLENGYLTLVLTNDGDAEGSDNYRPGEYPYGAFRNPRLDKKGTTVAVR